MAAGAGGEADPAAAGVGVGVGAAFAGEVGEEEESFATGLGALRFGDEKLVGIDLALLGDCDFGFGEIVAEPLETSAG